MFSVYYRSTLRMENRCFAARPPPESFPLTVRENIPQIFHIVSLGFLHFSLRDSRAGARALPEPQPELSAGLFACGKNPKTSPPNIIAAIWVKFDPGNMTEFKLRRCFLTFVSRSSVWAECWSLDIQTPV